MNSGNLNNLITEHSILVKECSDIMTNYRIADFAGETEVAECYLKMYGEGVIKLRLLKDKRNFINKK